MGEIKYFYKGMSLHNYCMQNDLSVSKIYKRIHSLQEDENYKGYTIEEIVEMAVNTPKINRYQYNGTSLYKYCKENGLSYSTFRDRLAVAKKDLKYKGYSESKIINIIMKQEIKVKYFYKGQLLIDYCRDNGLNYPNIVYRICKMRDSYRYKLLSVDEIVDRAVNEKVSIKKKNVNHAGSLYKYKGVSLISYCNQNNLNYNVIHGRINRLKKNKKYKNYSKDELVELAIDHYQDNRIKKYYKGVTLISYCKQKGLDKAKVYSWIDYYKNRRKCNFSDERIIEMSVNKTKENSILFKIKTNKFKYGVNYLCVKELSKKISLSKAIKLTYLFGDLKDDYGNKIISSERLIYVKNLIDTVDINTDFKELVWLYKAKIKDTRGILLNKQKKMLERIISVVCDEFDIDLDGFNKSEFESELNLEFMKALDEIDLIDKEDELYLSLEESIKNMFKIYLQENVLYLNKVKFNDNVYYKQEEDLNQYLKEGLYKLDAFEYKFIMLRYKKNYSIDMLSKFFKVKKETICLKEEEILNKLKTYINLKKDKTNIYVR